MSQELFRAAYTCIGHLRGGLAMATVCACAGFGAICGSSIAHLACRKLDLARLGELARIAEKIEQDLPQSHGVHGQSAEVLWGVNDEAVLVLLSKLSGGGDDIVNQRR